MRFWSHLCSEGGGGILEKKPRAVSRPPPAARDAHEVLHWVEVLHKVAKEHTFRGLLLLVAHVVRQAARLDVRLRYSCAFYFKVSQYTIRYSYEYFIRKVTSEQQ